MRVIALSLLFALAAGGPAEAYPWYQFTSDSERCADCHFSPGGGGLLNEWGREEAGDNLSMGGNGAFLHGAVDLPSWLNVGGDVRLALLTNDAGDPEGAELAIFPMQAELALRIAWQSISAVASIGLRSAVRTADLPADSDRSDAGFSSYIFSREHFVQWAPEDSQWYARAGRFYAPFGLRLPDHTTYIRRHLGFNLFGETYGIGGGYLGKTTEIHVTGFVSDELQWSASTYGGASAVVERGFGKAAAAGQLKLAIGENDTLATAGAYGKYWMESLNLLLMAEVDTTWQSFKEADADRWQLVAHAGPVWIPTRGLYLGAAYELFDQDVVVTDVERHGVSAWLSLQPTAHVELMLSGRAQWIGETNQALTALLQLHYYL